MWTVSRILLPFTGRYKDIIYIYIYGALLWRLDIGTPSIKSKISKNVISSINLERVINPNPLWWSCHIQFPWKLFGVELSHWYIEQEQSALAPLKDLALNAWMNKIAILCAWIYKKLMRPNILAFPRTTLQKLVLLHVILNAYRYYCSTVNRYERHYFVLIATEKSKDALDQLI